MKRFLGLTIATAALLLPVTPAFAGGSAAPAEYRAECDQVYEGGKALFDALIGSPAKALLNPLEAGLCGEAKHAK